MNIRLMNIDDYERVYDLWMHTKGVGLNNLDDSKEGINKLLKRNPNTCFVCEKDNQIVGVILCGNDGRRAIIYHLAVKDNYRRQGIATSLLDKCLSAIKEEGINKVFLVNFKRNELANSFWEKKGFKVREDLYYRDHVINEMVRYDL